MFFDGKVGDLRERVLNHSTRDKIEGMHMGGDGGMNLFEATGRPDSRHSKGVLEVQWNKKNENENNVYG